MEYKIMINEFEGPMDLLLHLIKKSDIDIIDINLEEIIKQYLDYIRVMENLNLDIASEYLTMAAELLVIKSSLLLPKQEIEEDEDVVDLKQDLINRLIEYKQYKEVTNEFKQLEESRREVYTKIPESLKEYQTEEAMDLGDITIDDLVNAFSKFLTRKEMEKPLNTKITTKEFSIGERSNEIRTILKRKKKMEFSELFEVNRKDYIVVTFLSILSLAKKQEIEINQEDNFNKIYLSLKGEV